MTRNNLKLEVTSFIGREREIEQATQILEHSPILTLTGPGGVGKSRVGLRLARLLLGQFEDGAWIVECGALTDPDFVLPAVVSTIGLPESAGLRRTPESPNFAPYGGRMERRVAHCL